jgi:hypothetical protein
MISELAAMMEERLKAFKAKSGKLPSKVLVYRDGVSEVRQGSEKCTSFLTDHNN